MDKPCWKHASRSSCSPVLWVDCGAFLLWPGPSCGLFTQPNNPSLACCKHELSFIVKKSSTNDWVRFCRGVKITLYKCLAIVGLALVKCIQKARYFHHKPKSAEDSSHEEGFTLVALCLLLPFLMVLIAIFIVTSFWLKNFWGAQKTCEDLVLKAQEEMAILIPELLDFNPEILQLRAKRTSLHTQLAAAVVQGNAVAIAALTTQLKAVQARLVIILVQQNLILQKARHSRWTALARFKSKSNSYGVERGQAEPSHFLPLGLEPDQEQPAVYKIPSTFLETQSLEIQWTQNLWNNSDGNLLKILSLKTSWMKRSCTASLERKTRKWQERLIKGRAWSNYSY